MRFACSSIVAAVMATAATFGVAAERPAVVANIKVVSDKVADVSDLASWKKAYIKEGMSDRDKALAIWECMVSHQFQDSPPHEFLNNEGAVQDAFKMMNVYGYSYCGVVANEITSLAREVGLKARINTISGHVVPEIWWEDGWHMLDASLINFFVFKDQPADAVNGKFSKALTNYKVPNGKIASIEEVMAAVKAWYDANPGYLDPATGGAKAKGNNARLSKFQGENGWQGWKRGPKLLVDSPLYDDSGWWPARTHGWYSTMQEYDGSTYFPYEAGYSMGYRVNIQLRPGERLVRNWSNKGLYANMDGTAGDAPYALTGKRGEGSMAYTPKFGDLANGRIGNGELIYNVPLDESLARNAWRFENLKIDGKTLQAQDGSAQGILEIRNPTSYVYLKGEVAIDATVPAGGSVGVYLSLNNGLDWKQIGKIEQTGKQSIDLSSAILRHYDYRLRVLLNGAGTRLAGLNFRHDVQHSQRPLPALDRGANTITFSAATQEGTVTIEGGIGPAGKGGQLKYSDFHPVVQDLAGENLMVDMAKGMGSIQYHVETPAAMSRLRIFTEYRARDKRGGWDVQVSFDGGKTFKSVAKCEGGYAAIGRYVEFADIPSGAKAAEIKWAGTAANNATLILNQRIDADYAIPNAGFRPVKTTYQWEEGGIEKRDVHVAKAPQETYTITCGEKPVMKSITLELAE